MGFVRNTFGIDLTGGGVSDAAGGAAREQAAASKKGVSILREDLAPFRDAGQEAAGALFGNVFQPQAQDPNTVINNPFFQALAQDQDQQLLAQRAALGLAGSGGTNDALIRQRLLLGNQFQQQERGNVLAENQARFNQLFNTATLGQNSAAQSGTASLNGLTGSAAALGNAELVGAQQRFNLGKQVLQGAGAAFGALDDGAVGGAAGGVGPSLLNSAGAAAFSGPTGFGLGGL